MDLTKREIQVRASSGVPYGYTSTPKGEPQPQPDPVDLLHDLLDSDNVLAAAFDATTDVMTMNGYSFEGKNERKVQEAYNVFDEEIDFDEELDNLIQNYLKGDAYLEFVDGDKGDREVHTLESREMYIDHDEHGEIVKFIQRPLHSSNKEVFWTRDQVIHFPIKKVGTRVYSQNPNKSIIDPLRIKKKASKYLESIFDNFPPKLMYILKNANREQSDAFINHLRTVKFDPKRDVVAYGDADVKQTGIGLFDEGLMSVLDYLRKEIAMITRIPPSWLGIREAGGRGTGEIETLAFFSKIKKMQHKIASKINKYLMPKLGLDGVKFKFNPVSLMDEKTVIEIARHMKEMGFEDDVVTYYLKQKAVQIPNDAAFKEIEQPMTKDKDLMPSRQRENKLNDKMSNNLNEQGVSEEGKRKLEERSQSVRSAPLNVNENWVYDALSD